MLQRVLNPVILIMRSKKKEKKKYQLSGTSISSLFALQYASLTSIAS